MERTVKSFPNHNIPCNLPVPTADNYQIFKSMVVGLRSCPITKAISTSPAICEGMIVEFWKHSSVDKAGNNGKGIIKSTIRDMPVEVTVQMVREVLGFNDQDKYPSTFKKEKVLPILERMSCEGLDIKFPPANKGMLPPYWRLLAHVYICCVSSRNTKTDDMTLDISSAVAALVMGWEFNYSQVVFDTMVLNTSKKTPTMLYLRFLQMILDERYPHIPRTADRMNMKALGDFTYRGMVSATKYQGLKPLEKFGQFPETEGVQLPEPITEQAPETEVVETLISEPVDKDDPEIQYVQPPSVEPPIVHEIDSEDDEEANSLMIKDSEANAVDLVKVKEELDSFVPSGSIDSSVLGKRLLLDKPISVLKDDEEIPEQESDLVTRKRKRSETDVDEGVTAEEGVQKEIKTAEVPAKEVITGVDDSLVNKQRGSSKPAFDFSSMLQDQIPEFQDAGNKEVETEKEAPKNTEVSGVKFRITSSYGATSSGASKDKVRKCDIDLFELVDRVNWLEKESSLKDAHIAELIVANNEKSEQIKELQSKLGGMSATLINLTQALKHCLSYNKL